MTSLPFQPVAGEDDSAAAIWSSAVAWYLVVMMTTPALAFAFYHFARDAYR